MQGLFKLQLKIDSWTTQHWEMNHFPRAFMDEYLALMYGIGAQVYEFAKQSNQSRVDSNVLTFHTIMDQFKNDFNKVRADFKPTNFDYPTEIDDIYTNIRQFRLAFKDRDDKTLTPEEETQRIRYQFMFVRYSMRYDIDCINEKHDLDEWIELKKRVANQYAKFVDEAMKLNIYKNVSDDGLLIIDDMSLIDEKELRHIDHAPETPFDASNVN